MNWIEGSGWGWFGWVYFCLVRIGIVKMSVRIMCLFFSVKKIWVKRNGEVLFFWFYMFWLNMFCFMFYIVFINYLW